jgi:hypothetical protein
MSPLKCLTKNVVTDVWSWGNVKKENVVVESRHTPQTSRPIRDSLMKFNFF